MKKRYIIPSVKVHKIRLASMFMDFSNPQPEVIGEGDETNPMEDVDMNGTGEGID